MDVTAPLPIHTFSDAATRADDADGMRAPSSVSPLRHDAPSAEGDIREASALPVYGEASASGRLGAETSLGSPDIVTSRSPAGEPAEAASKLSAAARQPSCHTPPPSPRAVPLAESDVDVRPSAGPVADSNVERCITAEATSSAAAHPTAVPVADSDAAVSGRDGIVTAQAAASQCSPASTEDVGIVAIGLAAASQSTAPSASAAQLTEQQRLQVEASRQRALERKRSREQMREQCANTMHPAPHGGSGEHRSVAAYGTAMSGGGSAPKVLTDAQRALLEEKQEAARRLRAERQLHKERKAVAARLGPLRAGFFVAARHVSSSSTMARDQGSVESAAKGASASRPDGSHDTAILQGGGTDDGDGGNPGSSGGGTREPAEVRIEECGRAQIDTVFAELSTDTLNIAPLEPPPTLNATLREYQKQALGWMVERESMAAAAATVSSSAWQEYRLPDGTHFFVHPLTGCVQGCQTLTPARDAAPSWSCGNGLASVGPSH